LAGPAASAAATSGPAAAWTSSHKGPAACTARLGAAAKSAIASGLGSSEVRRNQNKENNGVSNSAQERTSHVPCNETGALHEPRFANDLHRGHFCPVASGEAAIMLIKSTFMGPDSGV
jgi:hypothetical protein